MSEAKDLPHIDILTRAFNYDPETGRLTWNSDPGQTSQRNSRLAGKPAGTTGGDYVRVKISGQKYFAHRIIWVMTYGSIPGDAMIDHINGDGRDNRIANLRLANPNQNQHNRLCDAGRAYKGVYAKGRKWKAEITNGCQRKYLGMFDTEAEAANAYDEAAREMHGEYAKLNFTDKQAA